MDYFRLTTTTARAAAAAAALLSSANYCTCRGLFFLQKKYL